MKKIIYLCIAFLLPATTQAHVAYVVGKETMKNHGGGDASYLLSPFTNYSYIGLMIATLIVVGLGVIVLKKTRIGQKWSLHLDTVLRSYHEFIPWIIRLTLGIALIGAGTSSVLISPILTVKIFSSIEILLGFFLMAGFLLVPTILVSIILYLYALTQDYYILGNLDFVALCLGFLVFHSARPGVDDILGINLLKKLKISRKYLALVLRIGIGLGMIFLALYEKILNPHFMELVINQYHLSTVIPVSVQFWVLATGLIELVIGICLLIGWYTRAVSIIAIFVLSLTFFFFKEGVYSHITLFGTLSILAIESGGFLSIDNYRSNKKESKL